MYCILWMDEYGLMCIQGMSVSGVAQDDNSVTAATAEGVESKTGLRARDTRERLRNTGNVIANV